MDGLVTYQVTAQLKVARDRKNNTPSKQLAQAAQAFVKWQLCQAGNSPQMWIARHLFEMELVHYAELADDMEARFEGENAHISRDAVDLAHSMGTQELALVAVNHGVPVPQFNIKH
jgi:hypothetical protein